MKALKLLRLAALALAALLGSIGQSYAAPRPQILRVTPGLHAQIGGSACITAGPGSPNWTGTAHGVCLTWVASTSTVVGYKLYRGAITGGPYVLLSTTLDANLFFLDSTASVSTTYFYVATAVDANGDESPYSNQVSITTPATFPSNPSAPTGLASKVQ